MRNFWNMHIKLKRVMALSWIADRENIQHHVSYVFQIVDEG